MDSSLAPFLHVLIFLVFLVVIKIPPSLSIKKGEMYERCSKVFTCGNLTGVGYPFWGGDRAAYCGRPKLELKCQNYVPTIELTNVTYRILAIDGDQQILKIARFSGICNPQFVDSIPDPLLFYFVSDYTANVTIFYGCPPWSNIGFNITNCEISGLPYRGVRAMTGAHGPTGNCNTSVIVIVGATGGVEIGNQSGLEKALRDGVEVKLSTDGEECIKCTKSGGKCGYDRRYNQKTCFCPDLVSGTTACPSSPPGAGAPQASSGTPGSSSSNINTPVKIAIGISTVIACIILVFISIYCINMKCLSDSGMVFKKERNENHDIDVFLRNFGNLVQKRYKYSYVKKMTNSFRDKLGQGGYGCVYKGRLSNGQLVAVKVLSEAKGNGEEFINEVVSISRTCHVNIVSLLGFCYERTKKALIYEFMPNGSLDQFIYEKRLSNVNAHLEWKTLYEIGVGVARGLEYLHRGCNTRILHFDIKPHNILLDEDFCPKISDFGLAKLCQKKESIISMLGARGTVGYIAPEVFSRYFGGVSYKSDVYSYGMMILEIAVGREKVQAGSSESSEIYFSDWIYKYLESGVELKLHRSMKEEEEEVARKMTLVGLWCIQAKPSDRPSMTKVVEMLEGSIDSLQIPPKPFLSSPPRTPQHSSSISSSS